MVSWKGLGRIRCSTLRQILTEESYEYLEVDGADSGSTEVGIIRCLTSGPLNLLSSLAEVFFTENVRNIAQPSRL